MELVFTKLAWSDYQFWAKNDRKKLQKINELIREMQRTPFEGKGKPEPLRFDLAGFWSRRIDHEHRIVYQVGESQIRIISCRHHYN